MLKVTKKMQKALDALNNAITNLPEFQAVMKCVPRNVAVTHCGLVECDTKLKWGEGNNLVIYEGEILNNANGKDHQYVVDICGSQMLYTKKSLKQIADEIHDAIKNAPKAKNPDLQSLKILDYLRDKHDWNSTDEIYPHMWDQSEGTFSVPAYKR